MPSMSLLGGLWTYPPGKLKIKYPDMQFYCKNIEHVTHPKDTNTMTTVVSTVVQSNQGTTWQLTALLECVTVILEYPNLFQKHWH